MSLFATLQKRNCEANKKISYAQRSGIESKKALDTINYTSLGNIFSVNPNEVIESAIFDKIVRDCRGNLMRKSSIRRLRKVGSDEWYSLPISIGNSSWENQYANISKEEVLTQGQENQNKAGSEDVDENVNISNEPKVIQGELIGIHDLTPDDSIAEKIENTIENIDKEKAKGFLEKNKGTVGTILALGVVGYLGYVAIKNSK